MRVFMLGWEFPPFISGGLGTACYGLTKALNQRDTSVIFVLPKAIGAEYSSHVRLLSPQAPKAAGGDRTAESVASEYALECNGQHGEHAEHAEHGEHGEAFSNVTFKAVPSRMISPYQSVGGRIRNQPAGAAGEGDESDRPIGVLSDAGPRWVPGEGFHYGGDLLAEAKRYADLCVDLARGEDFDVVHAHDWLTFPAGMAVAAATGKPLIVHVHSTEFDRSGENVNQQVYEIERRGVHAATRVIAVSYLTKSILMRRYGVESNKIQVVYNGIENGAGSPDLTPRTAIRKGDRIVLYLGRVTMQKGPEYFVRAAKKVLEKIENVKFVMAGSGDMITQVIEMAAEEGIGHRILFTGFLHGADVERVFKMADVYVMPSVSEPFGIAPLEAISHDVPVIISKTSGVAEVLTHALKVDFWDIDEMANKIIAVLRHPPLSSTLREHADLEVRGLTWEGAADKCRDVYESAMAVGV